jgi:hypothetical protein
MPVSTTDRILSAPTILQLAAYPTFPYAGTLGAYAPVAGITSIGGPEIQVDEVDLSELDSTTLAKIFAPGWFNAGELPIEANFTQVTYALVLGYITAGTTLKVRIDFKNGYSFLCNGFVKGQAINAAEGSVLVKAPITLKLSGVPTLVLTSGIT